MLCDVSLGLYCLRGDDMKKKLLIIEDDRTLVNGISLALQSDEICVEQCFDLNSAKKKVLSCNYDLLILDINLPDGSGLDFLRIFKKDFSTPVILLSANDLEMDIVSGLEMGADDYITKPFSLAIFRARVNTQLKKMVSVSNDRYEQAGFIFDFDKMLYYKNSILIDLSKTEQRLLRLLIENRGITLRREFLIDRLWTDGAEYVDENALSVTIKRLRDKLEERPSSPEYIKTVYGIGYKLAVLI